MYCFRRSHLPKLSIGFLNIVIDPLLVGVEHFMEAHRCGSLKRQARCWNLTFGACTR